LKRKDYYIIPLVVIFLLLYVILSSVFPKNANVIPFFLLLLALDHYLWASFKDRVFALKPWFAYTVAFGFWTPTALIVGVTLLSLYYPFTDWYVVKRMYFVGAYFIIYISKLFPILFLAINDIVRFFRWMIDKIRNHQLPRRSFREIPRDRLFLRIGWSLGWALFFLLIAGMLFWVYSYRVREVNIRLADLPESFNGYRILQISDLHLGSYGKVDQLEEAITCANGLNPDVVFFTGDLVNYTTDEAYPYEQTLKKLKARDGIFCIMGNHDYGDYISWDKPQDKEKNLLAIYDLYSRVGWTLLNNEHVVIRRDSASLGIAGVENWGFVKRFQRKGDVAKAIRGIENLPVILMLSHDPTHWEKIISKDYQDVIDITFSGHTHGFQVGINRGSFRWSPVQFIYEHWADLYSQTTSSGKTQYLYVNRGLGFIGYPGRVGVLPEITLIELHKE